MTWIFSNKLFWKVRGRPTILFLKKLCFLEILRHIYSGRKRVQTFQEVIGRQNMTIKKETELDTLYLKVSALQKLETTNRTSRLWSTLLYSKWKNGSRRPRIHQKNLRKLEKLLIKTNFKDYRKSWMLRSKLWRNGDDSSQNQETLLKMDRNECNH